MFKLIKLLCGYLEILILKHRHDVLVQACYSATAFSVEKNLTEGLELNENQRRELAIPYLQKLLPGMTVEDCRQHLLAMEARLVGVGHRPEVKL